MFIYAILGKKSTQLKELIRKLQESLDKLTKEIRETAE